jgi:heme A synthase
LQKFYVCVLFILVMDKRDSIIKVITSPLGFFALALLIVEGFLGTIVIGSGTEEAKVLGMWMAISAFGGIVIIVALMVWKIPENLTLRGEDWMERMKHEKNWGSDSDPITKDKVDQLEASENIEELVGSVK